MKTHILDTIEFKIDHHDLVKKLRVQPDSPNADKLKMLVEEARTIARPKAIYKVGQVTHKEENSVRVNNILLTSRVLRVNLENVDRLFAYVATCGQEISEWAATINDAPENSWVNAIMDEALDVAIDFVCEDIKDRYHPGPVGFMNPGPIEDWPISEQRPLFELIGDTNSTIGVELNKNMLMMPVKTVSEVVFPNNEGFTTCQLCPQKACTSREAPYDEALYESKYNLTIIN